MLLENALLVCIPLLVGFAIDGLLAGQTTALLWLAMVLLGLLIVAVSRRFYDTRVYGGIRVALGCEVNRRLGVFPISARTARLDMARELVDFLEEDFPELISGVIQIVASVVILASFGWSLAASALVASLLMLIIYGLFHQRYIRLNSTLNRQAERQVSVLEKNSPNSLMNHLKILCHREIQLSDTDAVMYGLIFLSQFAFVLVNLSLAVTQVSASSAGAIFAIVSYSWAFVESAVVLPLTLQSLSRLIEITQRINPEKSSC